MNFETHFNILSPMPGVVAIKPKRPVTSHLTIAEARRMADHINQVCACIEAADLNLTRLAREQKERNGR